MDEAKKCLDGREKIESTIPYLDYPVNCFYTVNNTSMHLKVTDKEASPRVIGPIRGGNRTDYPP